MNDGHRLLALALESAYDAGQAGEAFPFISYERKVLEAIAQQPAAEAHCATCSCAPGMTPAVRFDTTPAEKEGAVRDHLIRMGWTPPAEAQGGGVVAWAIVGINTGALLNVCHGSTGKMLDDAEYWPELGFRVRPLVYGDTAPPSTPVGVVLTAKEREWLEYAVDQMADDSEPEDATCYEVLHGLMTRVDALARCRGGAA